ncbi:coiled coil-containing protein [Cryptosporidium canis]|uniref:Coiled coil-containing protein n=1 Tax=Cryptosporidium canis TaxID=195482 RepID=A0A9D5DPR7_9CRYT|nr:coiled coil-containing protein [Cryptosporidium canis]
MDEKLDLKSKYEKLRKKYSQLKQQTVNLKDLLKSKESELECVQNCFEQLEKKHKDCIASLDASQYKETQLKRQIEEVLCQLELFKLNDGIKQEHSTGQANKVGQGILTGLLPMNGVIMNLQKNERLEEKVAVLQEELDLKILENEQLHIKEFDLKKQHQKVVDEHILINAKLKNEIENLHLEINYLKKNKESDNFLDELIQLKEKDKDNSNKIAELSNNISLIENSKIYELNKVRRLIPPSSLSELDKNHLSWVNLCRERNCFNFLKLESLILKVLRKVVIFVDNWNKCIECYIKKSTHKDEVIDQICQKMLHLLEEGNKNMIDSSEVVLQSEFILKQSIIQLELNYDVNGERKFFIGEINDIIVGKSINALRKIKCALNLQIILIKMEINKLSLSNNSQGFLEENKRILSRLFKIMSCLKKHIAKTNSLINFAIYLGNEPELINIHTNWTNSFHFVFLELFKSAKDHFDQRCVEIEDKRIFVNFLKKIIIEDIAFQDKDIFLNESFINPHMKLVEMETLRKNLHANLSLKIKNNIEAISAYLKDASRVFETLFLSECSTIPFFNTISKDFRDSLCSSTLEVSKLLEEKKDYMWELISSLYYHPSIVCHTPTGFNDLQIIIREAKGKLENSQPNDDSQELNLLNKKIEKLEETRNEQIETINNLMSQLNTINEHQTRNSALGINLAPSEVISDYSISESGIQSEIKKSRSGGASQRYTHEIFESQLREANETLERTVTRLQLRIDDLNDDIKVTRQSYDEQISLLSQHICSLSDKLAIADASTLSSFNQEIICYSCEHWSTLDMVLNKTKGACQKCKTKLLRSK